MTDADSTTCAVVVAAQRGWCSVCCWPRRRQVTVFEKHPDCAFPDFRGGTVIRSLALLETSDCSGAVHEG